MPLTSDQALALVKEPPNKSDVDKGKKYQSRLRVLTVPYQDSLIEQESGYDELLNDLRNTLTIDKYNAITKYFTFPMPIVSMSNNMLQDLYKVFDARNASFSIDYPNDRIREVGNQTLSELKIFQWIENKGKFVLQQSPNLVVVLDKDENGDPILLSIPNEKTVGYKLDNEGNFEVFIFIHSKTKNAAGDEVTNYGVYDSEYYRVVQLVKGKYSMELENPHNLGSCPARFFYDKPQINKWQYNRSIPISASVGSMQTWNKFEVFSDYADHYGPFPVVEYPDNGCNNDSCTDGWIYYDPVIGDDNQVLSQREPTECGVCAKQMFNGPGTALGIPVSSDPTVQDTRGVFRYITLDTKGLEYVSKRQNERENKIKVNTVGFNNVVTKEAVNESQVRALVDSRNKPLLEIKMHLDDLYKWMVEGIIKLTYDVDVKVSANYGTEFFILTEKDIFILIQEAKKAGAQSSEIRELNRLLIQTKYKNDPNKAQEQLINADVEPSPFDTRLEATEKFNLGMMTREDYYMKVNYIDLIGKFERDNGSVVQFGKELTYDKKIERIKATLLFYTNQKLESNEQGSTDDSDEPIQTGVQGASGD